MFRFLRVGRAVAFGARAGVLAVQKRRDLGPALHRGAALVTVVKPGEERSPGETTWSNLVEWAGNQTAAWYHASNVSRDQFLELASAAGIPERDREHFPELDGRAQTKSDESATTLFLWLPTITEDGFPRMSRNRLLMRVSANGVLTATSFPFDLTDALAQRTAEEFPTVALPVRTAYRVLALLRDRYKFVTDRYEDEIHRLE
ncbi:MAG: CorA family divalent cation transporter, partial [Gemmatimonadaceae bacterium]